MIARLGGLADPGPVGCSEILDRALVHEGADARGLISRVAPWLGWYHMDLYRPNSESVR